MINTIIIETPLGEMVAGATDEGVCLLEFHDRRILPTEYKDLVFKKEKTRISKRS